MPGNWHQQRDADMREGLEGGDQFLLTLQNLVIGRTHFLDGDCCQMGLIALSFGWCLFYLWQKLSPSTAVVQMYFTPILGFNSMTHQIFDNGNFSFNGV